jgi:hypothetical protein
MEGMSLGGGLEIGISCITVPHHVTEGQKHTHWPATRHHFQRHSHCGPAGCGLETMKSSTVIRTLCGVIAVPCVHSKSTRTLGMVSRCGTCMAPEVSSPATSIHRVPRLALTAKWSLKTTKLVTKLPENHSQVFVLGMHTGLGSFVAHQSPMKANTRHW